MSEEVVAYRINDAAGFGRRTLDHRRDMPTSMNGSTQHTRAMFVHRKSLPEDGWHTVSDESYCGSSRKKSISKRHSGCGNVCSPAIPATNAYTPPGLRKSGMPTETEIPAPVMSTTFLLFRMRSASFATPVSTCAAGPPPLPPRGFRAWTSAVPLSAGSFPRRRRGGGTSPLCGHP